MKYKLWAASCGVPMQDALDDEGCAIVEDFLRALLSASRHGRVNVSEALRTYREAYGRFRKTESKKATDGRTRANQKWLDKYAGRRKWLAEHDLPNAEAADLAMVEWGVNRKAAYQWIRLYRRQARRAVGMN